MKKEIVLLLRPMTKKSQLNDISGNSKEDVSDAYSVKCFCFTFCELGMTILSSFSYWLKLIIAELRARSAPAEHHG